MTHAVFFLNLQRRLRFNGKRPNRGGVTDARLSRFERRDSRGDRYRRPTTASRHDTATATRGQGDATAATWVGPITARPCYCPRRWASGGLRSGRRCDTSPVSDLLLPLPLHGPCRHEVPHELLPDPLGALRVVVRSDWSGELREPGCWAVVSCQLSPRR